MKYIWLFALLVLPATVSAEQKPVPVAVRAGSCGGILGCTGYMVKNDGTISSYKFGNVTKLLCKNEPLPLNLN